MPLKIFYIAEFTLPSTSAYSIQVLKMCDQLSKFAKKTFLFLPFVDQRYLNKNLRKEYNIKYKFKTQSIFKNKKNMNFFYRIFFALKVFFIISKAYKKEKCVIVSRSIISSLVLSLFQIKNYLELHHDLKGFTKHIFKLTNFNFVKRNINYILLHRNLLTLYPHKKKNYLILDDAVDLRHFKKFKKINLKNKNSFACSYFGSLTKGKGIEIIDSLSKKLKNIQFHVYGDLNFYNEKINNENKNITFYGHIPYSKIPKYMSKYDVCLMPYLKKVSVRSSNLETSKYMSPLKLFDYLASCKIIIASNLNVYSHILKNNFNSILIPYNSENIWCKKIIEVRNNIKKYSFLKKNAYKTALKFTWEQRTKKIIKHFETSL